MATLFSKPKVKKAPEVATSQNAAEQQAAINRERRRAGGSYPQTIVGSGLKTALGQ